MIRILLWLLLFPMFSTAQKTTIDKVKIYLDCAWKGDDNFLQREMSYVDYYKDPKSANLHIIINGEESSNGGEIVTFRFIGLEGFKNVNNTLLLDLPPNTSEDTERKLYLDILSKGVYAYVIKTSDNVIASVLYSKKEILKGKELKDKWNSWAFRASVGGYTNGEEGYSNSSYNGRLTINRITAESKYTSSFSASSNVSKFEYEDFSLVTEKKSKYANMTYVKSKGEHFSIGAKANYYQSTSQNYDGNYKFSPCVEYNLFPYSESSEHRLSLLYGVSANHNDYTDTTVYFKITENFASHLFEFTYDNSQTWGSFSFSINGNQILDKEDLKKYNVGISSNVDWNIAKGLSLNYFAYINFDRAQIHLPLNGATYEEIILRQKELESNYFYYMNIGLSYTFGSMKNNIVNPRF